MDEKNEYVDSARSRSDLDSDSSSFVSASDSDDSFDKEALLMERDEEGQSLPEPAKRPSRLVTWIIINVIATILIVRLPDFHSSQPMLMPQSTGLCQ